MRAAHISPQSEIEHATYTVAGIRWRDHIDVRICKCAGAERDGIGISSNSRRKVGPDENVAA